jgi:hypothetical protein
LKFCCLEKAIKGIVKKRFNQILEKFRSSDFTRTDEVTITVTWPRISCERRYAEKWEFMMNEFPFVFLGI